MALPADFSKIYGSTATGGLTPISNVNYAKGWEFVGSNPPTKNDFSYLQNLSDLKSQWLYANKLQRTDPFGDIKSDGGLAVAAALSNLGLGAGAPAIGIPFFWPSAAMPNSVITEWSEMTFLKFNGASFSATAYPKLALVFPGLIIPEARGVFPRIWDDGRGVDAGRTLLSDQLGTFVSVDINYADTGLVGAIGTIAPTGGIANVNGDSITTPLTNTAFQFANITGMSSSTSLPGNTVATRPRNIAFNFLVRAK